MVIDGDILRHVALKNGPCKKAAFLHKKAVLFLQIERL